MDYEKKYKEALGWMQSLYNGLHGATKEDAEHYFPELKESEDERIRKALITFFQRFPYDSIEKAGTNAIEALAWLEKKGECKDTFPIPTRETILSIWELGNDWKDITHGSISTKYGTQLEYIQKHWQESEYYLEKQGEQKPFDYEKATITQNDFASVGETATIELSSPIDCGDRIYHVSHKPIEKNGKQKQEWSEEDEKMANDLIEGCLSSEKMHHLAHSSKEIADWLNSIKDRMKG